MGVRLSFEGGIGSVTGANFLIETENFKALVDCGLIQGTEHAFLENRKEFGYRPEDIDYLFVTHAHLDHVGRIPKLVKEGFKGEIYSTPQTRDLSKLILEDAAGILGKEAAREGVLPLYEAEDVAKSMSFWKETEYHSRRAINDQLDMYLYDAGHVLGSAMIELTFKESGRETKVLFTGDLGNSPSPLLNDTESVGNADYVIMESVYGDRNHEPAEERRGKLESIVKNTAKRGGALVVPAFSIERTQVLLYELNHLVENGLIPSIPIFVDSPLATKVTEVYKSASFLFNSKAREEIVNGDDIFNFPRLKFTVTASESRNIYSMPNPKIIIAGSGMSMGGRVVAHEAHFLPDPKSTILLVGYQTLGTLGRELQEGARKVKVNGLSVPVRAKIESITGYSSHKDSDHLIEFVGSMLERSNGGIKKVFVAMGEPKASLFLVQKLRDNLGVNALYPKRGLSYFLDESAEALRMSSR